MGTNSKKSQKIAWITWEKQRRSISLAKLLNAEYIELNNYSNFLLRYVASIYISTLKIVGNRKSVTIVQNPSMVLALVATILGKVLSSRIIVDRHTDCYILGEGKGAVFRILKYISDYTLKNVALTIVTNIDLIDKVEKVNGRPFILPDPFPDIQQFVRANTDFSNNERLSCFVVASWSSDEPLEQLFEAASRIPEIDMYISGKPKSTYTNLINHKPDNLFITNYLSDTDYYSLMNQSDIVIAISTADATLVCGGYEAITLNKLLLTGNSNSLKSFYEDAAVYTDGSTNDLVEKIRHIIENKDELSSKIKALYIKREKEFAALIETFTVMLEDL